MASQGPNVAGALSSVNENGATDDWTALALAQLTAPNVSYATIGANAFDNTDVSYALHLTGFGFSIPAGATITGVAARVDAMGSASGDLLQDYNVQLLKAGAHAGNNLSANTNFGVGTYEQRAYGADGNMWGLDSTSLTPTDVNNSGFGLCVQFYCNANNTAFQVDYVILTVYYTLPTLSINISGETSIGVSDSPTVELGAVGEVTLTVSVSESVGASDAVTAESPITIGRVDTFDLPYHFDWHQQGQVLDRGSYGQWDYVLEGSPGCVVKVGSTYYMYYVGSTDYDAERSPIGRAIGVATSSDGISWTKYGSNPIITYSTGAYDEEGASNPVVLYDGSTWHMWYAASRYTSPGNVDVDIRYRTSTDGLTWTGDTLVYQVAGDEYLPVGAFKNGSTYYLYYIGPLSAGAGVLRLMSGTDPAALSGTTIVDSGTHRGASGLEWLDSETLALFRNEPNWTSMTIYTLDKDTPATLTEVRVNAKDSGRFAIMLDGDTWRMYRSHWYPVADGDYEVIVLLTASRGLPSPRDGAFVRDSATAFLVNLVLAASESIGVSDSASAALPVTGLGINVSESVAVTESVTAQLLTTVAVSESVAVTDYPRYYQDTIQVTDSVAVALAGETALAVGVSESIGVSDSAAAFIPTLTLATTEAVGVSDSATPLIANLPLSVGENVGVQDAPLARIANFALSVQESVGVTDAAPSLNVVEVGGLTISVSDTIALTDSPALLLPELFLVVSESIGVTDSPSAFLPVLLLVASESVGVSDSPEVSVLEVGTLAVSCDESVGVSDSPALDVAITLAVQETVALGDSPALALAGPEVNVSETVAVEDSASVFLPALYLSVVEGIGVSDAPETFIPVLPLSVAESVGVSDSASASVLTAGTLAVSVSDGLGVSDGPALAVTVALVASESIGVSDSAAASVGGVLTLEVSVSEVVALSDAPSVALANFVLATSESLSLSDAPLVELGNFVLATSESVGVGDSAQVAVMEAGVLALSVSEAVGVLDSPALAPLGVVLAVSDTVGVSDSASASTALQIAASEDMAVAENATVAITALAVSVSEAVAVSDSADAKPPLALVASESVGVSESASVVARLAVVVSEGVAVSDSPTFDAILCALAVMESIAVSEALFFFLGTAKGTYTATASSKSGYTGTARSKADYTGSTR